jgi:hypothetical protein
MENQKETKKILRNSLLSLLFSFVAINAAGVIWGGLWGLKITAGVSFFVLTVIPFIFFVVNLKIYFDER